MLLFVDFEHADGYEREHGQRMLAARTRITYRLEDLAGMHCHLVRYDRIDDALLQRTDPRAIFISGNSVGIGDYGDDELAPMRALLRTTERPVFGFCGGFQLLADALGSAVVPIQFPTDRAHNTEGSDPDPSNGMLITVGDDRPFEFGYHPVELLPPAGGGSHPLLGDLGPEPVFRHAHGLHVPVPPDGFRVLARTRVTPVQLAVHEGRRMVGTQFHPEYWTDEHPEGRTLIANFLRWADAAP